MWGSGRHTSGRCVIWPSSWPLSAPPSLDSIDPCSSTIVQIFSPSGATSWIGPMGSLPSSMSLARAATWQTIRAGAGGWRELDIVSHGTPMELARVVDEEIQPEEAAADPAEEGEEEVEEELEDDEAAAALGAASYFNAERGARRRSGRSKVARTLKDLPGGSPAELMATMRTLAKASDTAYDTFRPSYAEWIAHLHSGFSLLLHGFGSKKAPLDNFASALGAHGPVLVLYGYSSGARARELLHLLLQQVLRVPVPVGSTAALTAHVRQLFIAAAAKSAAAEPKLAGGAGLQSVLGLLPAARATRGVVDDSAAEPAEPAEPAAEPAADGPGPSAESPRTEPASSPPVNAGVKRSREVQNLRPKEDNPDAPWRMPNMPEQLDDDEVLAPRVARQQPASIDLFDGGERAGLKTGRSAKVPAHVYIVVHSIDGENLRAPESQAVLAALAALPQVHCAM